MQGATIELKLPEIDTMCSLLHESFDSAWHKSHSSIRSESSKGLRKVRIDHCAMLKH